MQLRLNLCTKKTKTQKGQSHLGLQRTAQKVEIRGFLFLFYDLQIWNVSPPSCLRLDHAPLVRGTYEHSRFLMHTTYKKPVRATQLTPVSIWKSLGGGNFENCSNVKVAIRYTHFVGNKRNHPRVSALTYLHGTRWAGLFSCVFVGVLI